MAVDRSIKSAVGLLYGNIIAREKSHQTDKIACVERAVVVYIRKYRRQLGAGDAAHQTSEVPCDYLAVAVDVAWYMILGGYGHGYKRLDIARVEAYQRLSGSESLDGRAAALDNLGIPTVCGDGIVRSIRGYRGKSKIAALTGQQRNVAALYRNFGQRNRLSAPYGIQRCICVYIKFAARKVFRLARYPGSMPTRENQTRRASGLPGLLSLLCPLPCPAGAAHRSPRPHHR